MSEIFQRTEMMLGEANMQKLARAHVAVFGVGGVGSYTVEALARAGVGTLTLVDSDVVSPTNINRQLVALHSTIGQYKVDVAKARILDINPDAKVFTCKTFYLPETAPTFDLSQYDYVVDAIDTVEGKITLICEAQKLGVPVISSMGAGNKLNPTAFTVADIYDTAVDPLAKVMRTRLRRLGIRKLKVVFSTEIPKTPIKNSQNTDQEKEKRPLRARVCRRKNLYPIWSAHCRR